jgi:3-deoxy-D-manno-octulosonate 8-phosphate phosphatase KdsC-like HAD superfamily phosphatase
VPLRCVYTDLDGTLLGRGASILRDGEGRFTLLAARALEACFRAGVEVVPMSGRTRATLAEDARLLGLNAYVYELGAGVMVDGEDMPLSDTTYADIDASGAPQLLIDRYPGRLEYHEPWHRGREVTHLMRGLVDARDADTALEEAGLGHLRLVDNGAIAPKPTLRDLPGPPHAYHLMPSGVSKAAGVAAHMRARGFAPEECIAVGDSAEDAGVADVVARLFLVANASAGDAAGRPNVEQTEGAHGEGFYEAVVRSIADGRTAWRVPG